MPTIQALKKKLRGIRSTQKIAKAMKTASTVKFSRLNAVFAEYSRYSGAHRELYERHRDEYNEYFAPVNKEAPACLVIMTANKGMCGSFNNEILNFATKLIERSKSPYFIILCGKKAESYFTEKKIKFDKSFVFGDIPKYEEASSLFEYIWSALKDGKISSVKLAYPKYSNMMIQTPTLCELFAFSDHEAIKKEEGLFFFPDKECVIKETASNLMSAFIFEAILESALGAQAATLMTMRSAYDTATEYTAQLESEINRKRQSQVTADVIETSAEHSQEN